MAIPAGQAPYLEATVCYPHLVSGREVKVVGVGETRKLTHESVLAGCRSMVVSCGYRQVRNINAVILESEKNAAVDLANREMTEMNVKVDEIAKSIGEPDAISALRVDTNGRMLTAFDGYERFKRWGEHYVRSLMRAHQL